MLAVFPSSLFVEQVHRDTPDNDALTIFKDELYVKWKPRFYGNLTVSQLAFPPRLPILLLTCVLRWHHELNVLIKSYTVGEVNIFTGALGLYYRVSAMVEIAFDLDARGGQFLTEPGTHHRLIGHDWFIAGAKVAKGGLSELDVIFYPVLLLFHILFRVIKLRLFYKVSFFLCRYFVLGRLVIVIISLLNREP